MATSLIKEHKRGARLKQMTNQQQMFCKLLLATNEFDLTKAAREAGYSQPRQMGQKLLKISAIKQYLGNAFRKRGEALEFTAKEVLGKLKAILNFDPTTIYDNDGYTSMERIKQLDPEIRSCITKIKMVKTSYFDDNEQRKVYENKLEVEMMSKDNALGLAMRHFGLMEPDLKVSVVSTEIKAQIIVEMLGSIGGQHDRLEDNSNVIDGSAVSRLAQE